MKKNLNTSRDRRRYDLSLLWRQLAVSLLAAGLAIGAKAGSETGTAVPAGTDSLIAPPKKEIRVTILDAAGRKPIQDFQAIAGVRWQAGGSGSNGVIVWQPHTLRTGREGVLDWPLEKAYEEMALRIEADGYAPNVVAWVEKKTGPQSFLVELRADQGTAGRVVTPDGKPAAGATVVLAMVQREAVLRDGKLCHAGELPPKDRSDRWRWPRFAEADAEGRFHLPPEIDPTAAVLVSHESGVREAALADFQKSPEIVLQPWGRIKGKAQWGDMAGPNRTVSLTIHREDYGYPGVIAQYEKTTSAADGGFSFERVLPGRAQLACPMFAAQENRTGFTEINLEPQTTHLSVSAGNNRALLGGQGRTVRGRLKGDSLGEVTFHFHPTAPHIGFPGDNEIWQAWSGLQKSPAGPLFFRDGLKANADGTFEITRVLPGRYQIFFSRGSAKTRFAAGQFVVPPEQADTAPTPQDIGEF